MDEALAWVAENQGAAALTWVAVVLATAVVWVVFKGKDEEKAVNFEVLVPEQCRAGWEGKVVEGGLKVCEFFPIFLFFFFLFCLPFLRYVFRVESLKRDEKALKEELEIRGGCEQAYVAS